MNEEPDEQGTLWMKDLTNGGPDERKGPGGRMT